ncbi:hypothetical protein MA16_Dca028645 [Dendrobium catenatum]|uniref:Uncharacterized protein n=1 Tax=Dendrobium catenatum TaxID=906689 RepID=A0A2I0VE34_9ASPA|nr:hypothetical protein MA16_Dca028645 [Dendrobium catenatum]
MHDTHRMARLYNPNNYPSKLRCRLLREMSPLNNPIKQLPSNTEVHHNMHSYRVLISINNRNHIGMPGQMMHYLNLPPHIIDILLRDKLPLGDRLASELLPRSFLNAEVGRSKLPLPQLPPEAI